MKISHTSACWGGYFSCGHLPSIILRNWGANRHSPMTKSTLDHGDHSVDGSWDSGVECSDEDVSSAWRGRKGAQGNWVFPGDFGKRLRAVLGSALNLTQRMGEVFVLTVEKACHTHWQVATPYWPGGNSWGRGTLSDLRGQGRRGKMEDVVNKISISRYPNC